MHELTIAQNIISIAEEEVAKQSDSGTVKKIFFKAGKMHAIIPESLQFGFKVLKKESKIVNNATLEIDEIPLRIKCKKCGLEKNIEEPLFYCSKCNSFDIEIISGMDMFVESIEFEDEKCEEGEVGV